MSQIIPNMSQITPNVPFQHYSSLIVGVNIFDVRPPAPSRRKEKWKAI